VFGVATSLGLGVSQMAAGLNVMFGIDPGIATQITLIAIISIVATLSAISGVGNGIRIISEWNIWLSIVLLAFFLFGGPFTWLMGFFYHLTGGLSMACYSYGLLDCRNRRRCCMARWMDHLLLGLVDFLGTICRYVHRKNQ
jgi:choline-glycine betaine transporter